MMNILWLWGCAPQVSDAPVPALMGAGMAVTADGEVWASDPDHRRVVRFAPTGEKTARVQLRAQDVPNRISVGHRDVAVVLRGSGDLLLVDRASLQTRRVPVCPEPRGITAEQDGHTVWVACMGGALLQIDLGDGQISRRLTVQTDLRDVVLDGEDLWVSRFRSAELLRIEPKTGEVLERRQPPSVDSDLMPVNANVDPFSPMVAWRTIANPDGGLIMVHQRGAEGLVDLSGSGGASGPGGIARPYYADIQATLCTGSIGGIVHSAVTWFDRDGSQHTTPPLPAVGVSVDIAAAPDGRVLVATSQTDFAWGASFTIDGVDAIRAAQGGPQAACSPMTPVATTVAVGTAVAYGPQGRPLTLTRMPFGLFGTPAGDALDPRDPYSTQRSGFDVFHRATSGGIACASCHPEGHEDGRTWRFLDLGPRRTQELARVAETAPFHWDGDLATLEELMAEVHLRRMGNVTHLDPVRSARDVAAFLDGIEPLRPEVAAPMDDALEGIQVFVDAGCVGCHTDPLPIEGIDVGTGGVFQVPRLQSLSARLPLMHDGCATTLRQRFMPECGGTDHGDADLTEAQVDLLVAYLATL